MVGTKLTEVIGGRLKQARDAKGWTQAQLGESLAEYLGEGWSRPAVSIAESGGRDFRAVELLALGLILGRPVGWFFRPQEDSPVELPGRQVPPQAVNALGSGPSGGDQQAFEDAVEAVTRVLAEHWPSLAQEVLGPERLDPDLVVVPYPPGASVEEVVEAARHIVEEREKEAARQKGRKS